MYLIFSMTQVVIDTIKGFYNVALLKFTMMILFTLLLNILCERGLSLISWIIVFVPFVLTSVITAILLFVFGLDPSSGKIITPSASKKMHHPSQTNDSWEAAIKKDLGEDVTGAESWVNKKSSSLAKEVESRADEVNPEHKSSKKMHHPSHTNDSREAAIKKALGEDVTGAESWLNKKSSSLAKEV
jgi:hypothetical protein